MKEIKYRAWLKYEHKMVEVISINFEVRSVCCKLNEEVFEFTFDEIVLMQYTGLKDKNGTKIYEGDIVKSIYNYGKEERITIGKVVIDEFGIYAEENGDIATSLACLNTTKECEVIGNIYENAEMLEA